MSIVFKTRQFYDDELQLLKRLKAKKHKEGYEKINYCHFVVAGFLGVGFTYLTTLMKVEFLGFLFAMAALAAYSYMLLGPCEIYKSRRRRDVFLKALDNLIEKGTVDTSLIKAKRIAIADEFDDEGDLYIIECNSNEILYLWDYDYNFKRKFPCLDFEIYENKFFELLGRQIYPLSKPVQPIPIDKKAKWNYMKKIGAPEHLTVQDDNFDKVVADFDNFA